MDKKDRDIELDPWCVLQRALEAGRREVRATQNRKDGAGSDLKRILSDVACGTVSVLMGPSMTTDDPRTNLLKNRPSRARLKPL
jgi:hypothetical protein